MIGPVIDEVSTIRPWFWRFICDRQALTDRKLPFRLTPITWSKSAAVISPSLAAGKMPALAHSTSMLP